MRRFIRPEPTRLTNLRPDDDPWQVAPLVRSVLKAPEEPTPRVKWRIRNTLRRKAEWRRRALRVALVGGLIFLTGGMVGAVVGPILGSRSPLKEIVQDAPAVAPPTRARHRGVRPAGSVATDLNPNAAELAFEWNPAASETPVSSAEPTTERYPITTPAPVAAVVPVQPVVELALPRPLDHSSKIQRAPLLPAPPPAARGDSRTEPAGAARMQGDGERGAFDGFPGRATSPSGLNPPERRREEVQRGLLAEVAPTSPLPASPLEPPPAEVKLALNQPPIASVVTVQAPQPREPPSAPPASQAIPLASPPPAPALSASEQGLLAKALRGLHTEKRPDHALAAIDDYLARFPKGVLHPEAMRLRTEALLSLGRKHTALAELDRQAFDGTTGGEDRRLLRGELRAADGRWRAAFEDFDAVVRARQASLSSGLSDEARLNERRERALWGRASARSHLGDDAGARTDLREYLRRFPQGRFANQATHLLGDLR